MDDIQVIIENTASQVITVGEQGPAGPAGPAGPSGASTIAAVASVALGGHRIVLFNASEELIYADNTTSAHAHRVLGMTTGAASQGQSASVIRQGDLTEPTWNWTPDNPVFLGANGQVTQTPPTAPVAAFSLVVGFPVSATRMYVSIRDPITLLP